jgi:hypothetical protein
VPITNKFHKFCWSTILGTSDDGKAQYGPKSMHIFIMAKIRHSHRQYDMRKWHGTKHELNCLVYMSSRGGAQGIQCPKVVQGGNLASRPSCMTDRPDKWAPRAQSVQVRQSFLSSDSVECGSSIGILWISIEGRFPSPSSISGFWLVGIPVTLPRSGWFMNHSKSFNRLSYVICAFTYHIVELAFVLSMSISNGWIMRSGR